MPRCRGAPARLATMSSNPSGAPPARANDAAASESAVASPIGDHEIAAVADSLSCADKGAGSSAPRILSALLDPDLEPADLASRVASDPALVIRVLRVANTPYYARAGAVSTVARAAQVLGQQTLRGIAAAACFGRMTMAPSSGVGPDLAAFRRHSLSTACAAQGLAQRLAPALADESFVAGLLHDLGKLVQWRLRPQAMAQLSALPGAAWAADRQRAELEIIATSHAHCGQRLLEAWQLPPTLASAVGAHHAHHAHHGAAAPNPAARGSDGVGLADLLALAELVTGDAGDAGDAGDGRCPVAELHPGDDAVAAACAAVALTLPATLQRMAAVFGD